jgi:hypothetical protein
VCLSDFEVLRTSRSAHQVAARAVPSVTARERCLRHRA